MIIAERIRTLFEKLDRIEEGFYVESFYDFARVRNIKFTIIEEHSLSSVDSSITVRFNDGSKMYVGNPAQGCFPTFISNVR
jgi:hypothetical protein